MVRVGGDERIFHLNVRTRLGLGLEFGQGWRKVKKICSDDWKSKTLCPEQDYKYILMPFNSYYMDKCI